MTTPHRHWTIFVALFVATTTLAIFVDHRAPAPLASAAITGPERSRFGLTELRRRALYQRLVAGEPADRAAAATRSENAIWNRNRDSYFHELEWRRIPGVCRRENLPVWIGYLILDEGIREHWPAGPRVTLYTDDAPLAPVTRPLSERRVLSTSGAE